LRWCTSTVAARLLVHGEHGRVAGRRRALRVLQRGPDQRAANRPVTLAVAGAVTGFRNRLIHHLVFARTVVHSVALADLPLPHLVPPEQSERR
jgi:hypothetical protein